MSELSELMKAVGADVSYCHMHDSPNAYYYVSLGRKGVSPQANVLYVCTEETVGDYVQFSSCAVIVTYRDKKPQIKWEKLRCEVCLVFHDDPVALMCVLQEQIILRQRKTRMSELGSRIIVQKPSLGALVHNICEIIGNPVSVYDTSYNLLAMESMGLPVDNRVWNTARTKGCFPPEIIEEFRAAIGERDISRVPFLCTTHAWENMHCLVIQLMSRSGELLGSLAVYEAFNPFAPEDAGIVVQAAEIISECLMSALCVTDEKSAGEAVFGELISGEGLDAEVSESGSAFQELQRYSFYYVGYVHLLDDPAKQRQCEYFCREIYNLSEQIIAVTKHKNVVILMLGNSREELDELSNVVAAAMKKHSLAMGLSNCFSDLTQAREMYIQAKQSYVTGSVILEDEEVYRAQDVLFYALIHNLSPENIKKLYETTFYARIREFDLKQQTNYCETIVSYTKSMFSSSQTAEKLYIHKNSLLYRLGRAKALFAFDFGNFHDVFDFWMGYKLFIYLAYLERRKSAE